jgi:hypothetical protein
MIFSIFFPPYIGYNNLDIPADLTSPILVFLSGVGFALLLKPIDQLGYKLSSQRIALANCESSANEVDAMTIKHPISHVDPH